MEKIAPVEGQKGPFSKKTPKRKLCSQEVGKFSSLSSCPGEPISPTCHRPPTSPFPAGWTKTGTLVKKMVWAMGWVVSATCRCDPGLHVSILLPGLLIYSLDHEGYYFYNHENTVETISSRVCVPLRHFS